MRAAQINSFGPPKAISVVDIPKPKTEPGQVLVDVHCAGVAPWDALIRSNASVTSPKLPLILGSDLSGVVDSVGPGVSNFKPGDEVYGVTNEDFIGAYAEYAIANAKMLALKPKTLNFAEAASAPVVAVTAYQMLFEYAHLRFGQTALIHGAAGNVGAYAVQLARNAGVKVIATASAKDRDYLRSLGAHIIIDYRTHRFEEGLSLVDAVIDMVGGETRERSMQVLKPDGVLITVVSPSPDDLIRRYPGRVVFFLAAVTTHRLNMLANLFDTGKIHPQVGTVLPLDHVVRAHEMLAGAPHNRGKIVLQCRNFT
jgi:NADPH:quinone reductase-like Zn-dependent oxidoreductase